LSKPFELARKVLDRTVDWITVNEMWLSNVLPDSMVVVLFIALGAYSLIQLQYAL
jgi:hypothetical protein